MTINASAIDPRIKATVASTMYDIVDLLLMVTLIKLLLIKDMKIKKIYVIR